MLTISNYIAIGSLIVAIICLTRNVIRDKAGDNGKTAEAILNQSFQLNQISATTIDIKSDVKSMQGSVANLERDIVVLKEQMKVANHRIEDLEKNNEKI